MQYSDLMHSAVESPGSCSVNVPEDWTQGRSVFGGLQSAIAVRAMRTLLTTDVPLRTLQTTFIAPVPAGMVQARARILRSGKSATHVEARLVEAGSENSGGDETTLAIVIGVFGAARASIVSVIPRQPAVECAKPIGFPYVEGASPGFTQHFSSRWLRGGLPFTGNTSTEIVVETSLKDSGGTTESHVLAIADLIPPIALSQMRKFSPGSSLTWMLEFLADRFDGFSLDRWRVDAELIAARDGYTNQSAIVWAPDGTAVALSRQSMVVFG